MAQVSIISSLANRRIAHLGIVFLCGIVGALVGLGIGKGVLEGRRGLPISLAPSDQYILQSDRLIVERGNRFPYLTCTDSRGWPMTIDSFFDGNPTVLFFWSFGCAGCFTQAHLWTEYIAPELPNRVKEVICLDSAYAEELHEHDGMIGDRFVVFVDFSELASTYNLVILPTIIAVDGGGFITYIEYGEDNLFDRGLVEALDVVPTL